MVSKTRKKDNQSIIIEESDSASQQVKGSAISPVDFSTGSNIVIRVEDLWKQYRLGTINHGTLTKDLQSWWARVRGKEDPNLRIDQSVKVSGGSTDVEQDRFWALKDISFDVKQGEVLGIIGKNGAGKSTLLKILSQVTTPTKGEIKIKGRIASLLEVGTGFHPELTGRENIFLNGAILGMSKSEIEYKFDEIVDFAEIEKFLYTPVKRYSSGMYVRLAFAIAAHLEPEILIVDEVLAVGDAQFQQKCLGKMKEVGNDGRTVLFVSHNMTAIRNLCGRAIWIHQGEICEAGPTVSVSESYLRRNIRSGLLDDAQKRILSLPTDPVFRFDSLDVLQKGESGATVLNGEAVDIEIFYTVFKKITGLRVYFDLCDEERNILIRSFNDDSEKQMSEVEPGNYVARASIPKDLLAPRTYELRLFGTIYNVRSIPPEGLSISLLVEKSNDFNCGYPHDPIRSKLLPHIPWQTNKINGEGVYSID